MEEFGVNSATKVIPVDDLKEKAASRPPTKPRTVPMEVLCLGFPRTGTQSLQKALNVLGYKSYHFATAAANNHRGYWKAGFDAKFEGASEPFAREEFDSLLGDYSALMDYPCFMFAEDLIAAYPDAFIILNTRPEDEWYESFYNTIWLNWLYENPTGSPPPEKALLKDVYFRQFYDCDFPKNGLKAYREHNERVRRLATANTKAKDRFLEYQVTQGWDPLCAFLGKVIPTDTPFPYRDFYHIFRRDPVEANRPVNLTRKGYTIGDLTGDEEALRKEFKARHTSLPVTPV